ncbi:MAG: peptidoglycan bridge formation glycyltransferase FemA/FemB family protein [bacterium]|nr:peptidoglycan bridge formation glycyltransferase FemA/FemB family protein [bacterium]
MTEIREIRPEEKNPYQKIASHLTQSWDWGKFREKTGVKIYRFGEFNNSKIISAWQIFFHTIPHANFTVGYLPRTQLPNKEIINFLRKIGREKHCLFIRLEPNIPDSPHSAHIPSPYRPGKPILPAHTFLIDLTSPEEEILKRMHEKTRYNIRRAEKQEVKVREENSEESLETFLKFSEATQKRQGFYNHPSGYFRKQWQTLKPEKMIHLLVAYFQDTPLASLYLLHFKDTLYYVYGGSSDTYREKMPNQLLHWEAIKLGKRLGLKIYDLWGAYKDSPETKDPWYGVYRFKSGFGGELVNYVGAFDLVLSPLGYKVYNLADSTRWLLLKLKRRFHL